MLKVENIITRYGAIEALKGMSLEAQHGEVTCLLGPNGAGKTTTMKMVAGLLKPSEGRILVGGIDTAEDPVGAKKLIGYIHDRPYLYERLTCDEFLDFVGGIYSMDESLVSTRKDELMPFFGLGHCRTELIESYSHGMKQRLTFASACCTIRNC